MGRRKRKDIVQDFKVGDLVIPHKPETEAERDEWPSWNEAYMDIFDGRECRIKGVEDGLVCIKHPNLEAYYYFRPEWIEKAGMLAELSEVDIGAFIAGIER